jgi:hypothetical protein
MESGGAAVMGRGNMLRAVVTDDIIPVVVPVFSFVFVPVADPILIPVFTYILRPVCSICSICSIHPSAGSP